MSELCAGCRRPKTVYGWHRCNNVVLGFCIDCSESLWRQTGHRVAVTEEKPPRPYRWL